MKNFDNKLGLTSVKFSNNLYMVDLKNYNIYPINTIFNNILRHNLTHNESEIIEELKKKYAEQDILKELSSLNSYLKNRAVNINKNIPDSNIEYFYKEDIKDSSNKESLNIFENEGIVFINMNDFTDQKLIDAIDRTNLFLSIDIDINDLQNNVKALEQMKHYLHNRCDRYRIRIINVASFAKAYKMATEKGLLNFDIHLKSDKLQNLDLTEINSIEKVLMNDFHEDTPPYLSVVKDTIRVLAYKLPNKKIYNNEFICDLCHKKTPEEKLYEIYFKIGVLYFIKYFETKNKNLYNLLTCDLFSSISSKEKRILKSNSSWNLNLNYINKLSIEKNKELLVTYYDINKFCIIK